ncbi:SCO family protein [Corallococcus exercitus]|uniref:SCO family protein n=1 Tax=Corallococcus exercitus TaxID=2316736 RepID=UPI000EA39EA6|nr:SCO family protein [Corallococcus exercitus]RKG80201.1 SCO family protein [Corallococcus exercitus]
MNSMSPPRKSLPWLALAGVLAVALVLLAWPRVQRERARIAAENLPRYGPLPRFELTAQTGRSFSDADMRGHLYVADFFFTRCPTVCPLLTEKMLRVQRQARERGLDLRFASFSVDPRHDTPERLTTYARDHRIDTSNWTLLTGPLDQVETTVLEGFRVMMGRDADAGEDDFFSVFHGEHFILVDAGGQLRGYYRVTEGEEGLEALLRDARLLAQAQE